jgi:hypothetical protein
MEARHRGLTTVKGDMAVLRAALEEDDGAPAKIVRERRRVRVKDGR